MIKKELRKKIIALRPGFQTLETLSPLVLKNFQALELFQQAKAVGAYMPLRDEVDVSPLFQTSEHRIYIPAFDETIESYRMAKYTPELKKGKFGIPEPENPVWAKPDELDVILVPGVAFDRHGNRLGRGGGFYDRLLPHYSAKRVGIGFDFQCLEPYCIGTHRFFQGLEKETGGGSASFRSLEKLPAEPHDCRLDWLVTESDILKFAMNS